MMLMEQAFLCWLFFLKKAEEDYQIVVMHNAIKWESNW